MNEQGHLNVNLYGRISCLKDKVDQLLTQLVVLIIKNYQHDDAEGLCRAEGPWRSSFSRFNNDAIYLVS